MTLFSTKDVKISHLFAKKTPFLTIFSSQSKNLSLEKQTRTTGQKNALDIHQKIEYNIRRVITKITGMYLLDTMGHALDCRRGCFFYAKNPDEIWAGDAHFPDDKIKIV